ncbi:MAG: enzyme of heme biosynthesis [Rikenellaceae bacterium]|nr:enzyme of heme biosynthesis [Rikenellaceae bacterium]
MKKRVYSLIAALALVGGAAVAQDFKDDPRYGADPAAREQNVRILNFFGDAYKAKDYNTATNYLRQLIENAPKASENMYIRGIDIYKNKAAAAQTKEDRRLYVDSILWVYDKRIEAFGEHPQRGEAYLKGEKARLFMTMMPADRERLFRLFREALDEKHPFEPALAVMYFNSVIESFKLDDVTPEEVIDTYEQLSQRIAQNQSAEAADASKTLDDLFATSGAANCETVEKIYKPKYEADPENPQLIETILALLQRGKCSSEFYLTMLERYYKVNPKPEVAVQLASVFQEKKDFAKAMEYLRVGINNETDPVKKTNFLLQAATMSSASGSYREAAGFARQALELEPNNGVAYLLLGAAYGSGAGSACSAFDSQTAMWLAVDNLAKARQLLPSDDPQQEQIGRMIANYSANFPKTEETFMRGLNPGDPYTVSCGWISGRTTVRER